MSATESGERCPTGPHPCPNVGPATSAQRVRLVIEVDAELLDPSWTKQDLIENSVFYVQAIINKAEQNDLIYGDSQPYRIDTSDITVWTKPDYILDLQEGGHLAKEDH